MQRTNIKQHIVDVASKLFYTQGYNATGINEVIAKSEIAKATLYHHFKSKEDICIAYLEQRHHTFLKSLKEFVARASSSKHQLLSIFDFLRNNYREGDFHGCWAIKTLGELPPQNKKILAVIQKQKKELLLYLGEIVGDNIANISIAETEKISGGIYLLYESAITESHLHKNDWPIHLAKSIAPSLFAEAKLVS
ncbi:TetR/AcrR family transcriptional regulator [Croceitalea sp. MTPC9]|uniref:TetR/AcrR family transcriptional regulator n=1 Tax=unclassified Croceitalea TaxID=2632280 RepID=UPI002B3D7ADD|nr:TetR/AcrR family transcriptional regulator [Croceitalea sp. MTPC6]GMN16750.1 TetR/AcrR family transcriptional regulator [Croceitalea sp. MTPC9]